MSAMTPMAEDAYIIVERGMDGRLVATLDAQPSEYQVPPVMIAVSVPGNEGEFLWLIKTCVQFHNIKLELGRGVTET